MSTGKNLPGTPIAARHAPDTEKAGGATAAAPALPADALIILPVRSLVLFPGVVFPIMVGRAKSLAAAQEAMRHERQVGVLMQRDQNLAEPSPIDMHRLGTVANILRYVTAPDGNHHLVCQGEQRFRVIEFLDGYPFLAARVQRIPEAEAGGPEVEARFLYLRQQALEALQLLPQVPQDLISAVEAATSPAALADMVAAYMDL